MMFEQGNERARWVMWWIDLTFLFVITSVYAVARAENSVQLITCGNAGVTSLARYHNLHHPPTTHDIQLQSSCKINDRHFHFVKLVFIGRYEVNPTLYGGGRFPPPLPTLKPHSSLRSLSLCPIFISTWSHGHPLWPWLKKSTKKSFVFELYNLWRNDQKSPYNVGLSKSTSHIFTSDHETSLVCFGSGSTHKNCCLQILV